MLTDPQVLRTLPPRELRAGRQAVERQVVPATGFEAGVEELGRGLFEARHPPGAALLRQIGRDEADGVFGVEAEERGLLLLGEPRYDSFYAVSTLRMQLRTESDEILERAARPKSDLFSA